MTSARGLGEEDGKKLTVNIGGRGLRPKVWNHGLMSVGGA